MVTVTLSIRDDYWESFKLQDRDKEFIYTHLLELETPLTTQEIVIELINFRIRHEKQKLEEQHTSGGDLYQPKGTFTTDQTLVFPALGWQTGSIIEIRNGKNPELNDFQVIKVNLEDGSIREFASGLQDHILNNPPKITDEKNALNSQFVVNNHGRTIEKELEIYLENTQDYVRIAGRWFPRELLVDINEGHLNLAEAVLDMVEGGPLPVEELLKQIELDSNVNPKLVEFSLDHALQEDARFDEVGPAGDVLWFLKRLEPGPVLQVPEYLQYQELEYDRSILNKDMQSLERQLDDELSPREETYIFLDEADIRLIAPHWISGTLPISARIAHLFPTAYEAPRIRFILVDGETGESFPGWVVRKENYVYGLQEWYEKKDLIPGSIFRIRKGDQPGEVIIQADTSRSSREWIRTVLIGSDGGIVYAMLKQIISGPFDERMAIVIPDKDAIPLMWEKIRNDRTPFEKIVINTVRELAKLNPQNHVHASELYAAVNVIMRCPPGPILALLDTRPWFIHVGDLHYRLSDIEMNIKE